MRWQGVSSVDAPEGERGARPGTCLLVGAGVCVRAGCCRGLVARRVRWDRNGLMRRMQVRHRRQWPRPLPVSRHLDPRDSTQQTEPGSSRHDIAARARGKCPRPRTLAPVGRARLSTHRCTNVTQKHLSQHRGLLKSTRGPLRPRRRYTSYAELYTRPIMRETTLLQGKSGPSRGKQRCMCDGSCFPAKFWQFCPIRHTTDAVCDYMIHLMRRYRFNDKRK